MEDTDRGGSSRFFGPETTEYTDTMREIENLAERDTLNFGCGVAPVPGAINHDRWKHAAHVDIAFDLDYPPLRPIPVPTADDGVQYIGVDTGEIGYPSWPLPDARFSRVIALDVFEHLRCDIDVWLRECWRILKDDGVLVIRVAAWNNPVSYRDPTHRKVFHEETFHYFDPRQPLWADYGRIYFPDGPWFHLVAVERGNADQRWPTRGDICVVMRKVQRPGGTS